MNSFLKDVAQSLFSHYGEQLSQIDVVFASRRAIRYFFKELDALSAPRPRCFSIDEWVRQHNDQVKVESRFVLTSKLFDVYSKYHEGESFEQFYSFGNLLISDFDMIDRYMVDARALYSIVSDTRDIEVTYSDSLRDAAIEFWANFDTNNAKRHKQQEFLRVWRSLYDIYVEFCELLDREQIAYSGRVYRSIAEKFDPSISERKTIFAGLNALSTSEKQILSKLSDFDLADFIWDYDPRWLDDENSECGYFISQNIKLFGQSDYFSSTIRRPADVVIEVVESPSDAAQCKLIPELLSDISADLGRVDERVAIILTDENLLLPLLNSIPESIQDLNISMGYPLRGTAAYRFLELLIRAQRRVDRGAFYSSDVRALLSHVYLSYFKSNSFDKAYIGADQLPVELACLWRSSGGNYLALHNYFADAFGFIADHLKDEKELFFVRQIADCLTVVSSMVAQCPSHVTVNIYLSLLRDTINSHSIEFEGVSGRGLQIMGILESRALDFDRVIMLSMNDDNFPSSRPDSSYIPQLLLQGYGMPTVAEKSAIWSYYFYRLLQRSTKLNLLYCNVADGMTTGEQSRYIWQIEYSSPYKVRRRRVAIDAASSMTTGEIAINKTEAILHAINLLAFSPSSFHSYLACPLKFYFSSIEKIRSQAIEDEQITAADTGNLLHLVLHKLYAHFIGMPGATDYIAKIDRAKICSVIDSVMNEELGHKVENQTSMADITRSTLLRMVSAIVEFDAKSEDLHSIEFLEKPVSGTIAGVDFRGVIDRVDRMKDGSIRIIDYKSGSVTSEIDSIESLFDEREVKSLNAVAAQVLIYSVLARSQWHVDIMPAIYSARKMGVADNKFSPQIFIKGEVVNKLSITHYQQIDDAISSTIGRMADAAQPFTQTEDRKTCEYCPYTAICRR